MSDFKRALMELEAIDAVRLELAKATKRQADQVEIREIHARLISLYASLDVHNIESIIQEIDFKKTA